MNRSSKGSSLSVSRLSCWMVLLVMAACAPENEPAPQTKSTLLSRTWEVQSAESAYDRISYQFYEKGRSDNDTDLSSLRLVFRSDGTYTMQDISDTIDGTWQFAGEADNLLLDGKNHFTVLSLSETGFSFWFLTESTSLNGTSISVKTIYNLIPVH
ncbi:hypothetical protein [Larkinella soli]|uniref:hypothetical protein n=1 Tax=Larkinella soli TaxID=1770527 RepID=UPI000FFC19D3|nr:hypothetical protein [Larkinella soli]